MRKGGSVKAENLYPLDYYCMTISHSLFSSQPGRNLYFIFFLDGNFQTIISFSLGEICSPLCPMVKGLRGVSRNHRITDRTE